MIATRAVVDPATSGADLIQIAHVQPSLRQQVAIHPNASPDLLSWLEANRDPVTPPVVAPRATPTVATGYVDGDSPGWAVLGFFVPIVGLVLWIVWHDVRPHDSRMARNGFITSILLAVLVTVMSPVIAARIAASSPSSPPISATSPTSATGKPFPEVDYPAPVAMADFDLRLPDLAKSPIHVAITLGDWVAGQQVTTLDSAWETVGGQGSFPAPNRFDQTTSAFAFGVITFTQSGDPWGGMVPVYVAITQADQGFTGSDTLSPLGLGRLWASGYRFPKDPPAVWSYDGTDIQHVAMISYGPMIVADEKTAEPFIIAVDQVFTSSNPQGNPALDGLRVVPVADDGFTFTGTLTGCIPKPLWR